ncbi:unnamed protein product [Lasius platythorax]|uniref:Uncharacterized protein n=1 Tax=Lasius platythorax TaxID=488582 RepID=A0AAV2MZP7_9HYME
MHAALSESESQRVEESRGEQSRKWFESAFGQTALGSRSHLAGATTSLAVLSLGDDRRRDSRRLKGDRFTTTERRNEKDYNPMPGVNYAQPETRYSASNWYTDIDAALMGIQSTAQFVDKYHHIIGKRFSLDRAQT